MSTNDPIPAALREALEAPYIITPSGYQVPPSSWERAARARAMAAALRWAIELNASRFAIQALLTALDREAATDA